ncbi:hypothetical protein [Marinoscillum sp.]|uniref:hypothetical protein n=1 Tax=Marinoscillum sp. TaxID=2024838 RepID=UPI003BAA961C
MFKSELKKGNIQALRNASLWLAVLVSCSPKETTDSNTTTSFVGSHRIVIDTVLCEAELFSMEGYFRVIGNNIAYIQSDLASVLCFEADGTWIKQTLGPGEGPDESNGLLWYHGHLPDGQHLVFGSGYDFRLFDSEFSTVTDKFRFNWHSRLGIYETSDLEDPGMYDFHYRDEPFIDSQWLPVINNKAVVPVTINDYVNPVANLTKKPDAFFGHANTIGLVDLETGELETVFRKHPKGFLENKWLYFYNYPYRATDAKFIYVSDRLGPEIEVYDPDNLQLVETFGQPGKYANPDLDRYDSYEDFLSALGSGYQIGFSYYTHIHVDSINSIFFRSYHIKDTGPWGLQAYNAERELIIDSKVPFRFNVIGKIGDYYYADGIRDEENEILGIYRFKIKNE